MGKSDVFYKKKDRTNMAQSSKIKANLNYYNY